MKEQILSKLKIGACKRADLLRHLHALGYNDLNDRGLRQTIEEMIMEGNLIESSNNGYSLIANQDQLDRAVGYLNAKAEAIAIRKNMLKHNWEKSQPLMELKLF